MSNRSDNFTRADSATSLGTPSDGGGAWVANSGTWGIASNTGYMATSGGGHESAMLDFGSTGDCDVSVKITTLSGAYGIIGKAADGNNFVLFRYNGTTVYQLFNRVAGTFTQIGTNFTASQNVGDIIKMQFRSGTVQAFLNGTSLGAAAAFNSGSLGSNTKYGLYANSGTGTRFDDFAAAAPAGASFTTTPSTIPAGHAGNITLTFAGTGTNFVSGSTHTIQNSVTGTTTVTGVTWTASSTTSATLTVTTGAGTGTFTVTLDGTVSQTLTVGTPSFSISPNTGLTGATTSGIAATGVNTVWSQETAASLFTLSGGTGASLNTIAVTTDTAATFNVVDGSAAATLTITDAPTADTTSFFTTAAPATFAPTDTGWYWSPGTWDSDGSGAMLANGVRTGCTYAQSVNWGAYALFQCNLVSTGPITLNVDGSMLGSDSMALVYSVDGVNWSAAQNVVAATTAITLVATAATGSHTIRVALLSGSANNKWNSGSSPWDALRITGITCPGGTTTSAPTVYANTALFFGDSLTEGDSIWWTPYVGTVTSTANAGVLNYPAMVAAGLGCEFGQVGFGSQGWGKAGLGNAPIATTSWNLFYSGRSRVLYATPTHVFWMWGVADFTGASTTATIRANIPTILTAARTAWPGAYFWVWIPPGRQSDGTTNLPTAITGGVNDYQAATPDAKCFLMDFGTAANVTSGWSSSGGTPTLNTVDGVHPNVAGAGKIAAMIMRFVQANAGPVVIMPFPGLGALLTL